MNFLFADLQVTDAPTFPDSKNNKKQMKKWRKFLGLSSRWSDLEPN